MNRARESHKTSKKANEREIEVRSACRQVGKIFWTFHGSVGYPHGDVPLGV